jgi:hypothetical protein
VLDEQPLEHVLDQGGAAETPLDPRPATPLRDERQVTWPDVAQALRVQDDRYPRREVRLADDEPPPPADLDDETGGFRFDVNRS